MKLVQSAYCLAQKRPQEIRPMRGINHLWSCVAIVVFCVCVCGLNKSCRSQWPRGLRSAAARLLRLCVRISPGAWMFVCWECCVCFEVDVSATSWSLVQRSPTECGASLRVICKPRELGGPGTLGGCRTKNKTNKHQYKSPCILAYYSGCGNHYSAPLWRALHCNLAVDATRVLVLVSCLRTQLNLR